jgi:branched-chain amino acid transport system ATP-binding protein
MAEALLSVEQVSRRFGGLVALDHVSFTAEAGRITALIGPNGAGKTTLFAIVTGFLTPSQGRVRYAGSDITGEPPHRLARRGIARTFQIVQPFAALTVHENIAVGAHLTRPSRRDALAAAAEIARTVGLGELLDRPAAGLTVAARKRLEVARALATGPRLLLLDEVMAGLRPTETDHMVALFRELNATLGLTILLIEHVMRAVMALSGRVVVLHHGQVIAAGTPDQVTRDPAVLECYLGEEAV